MNKSEKIELFDLLQKLNNAIIGTVGHYDLSDVTLQTFIKQNNIMIDKHGKRNKKKAASHSNYFIVTFDSGYHANPNNGIPDKAHDILRHIRNSIAHSLVVTRRGKNSFEMTDKNKCGNESMFAKVRKDLLVSFVDAIISTYH